MPNMFGGGQLDDDYAPVQAEERVMTEKVFTFPELNKSLDSWADMVVDSPAANAIRERAIKNVLAPASGIGPAIRQDLICFMSAVYKGGHNAGQAYAEEHASKPFKVWEVWETVDDRGRKGEMIGVFTSKLSAEDAAKGHGWYGGDGTIISGEAIDLDGTIYSIRSLVKTEALNRDIPSYRDMKKAQALEKLTEEEIEILGIKQ